MPSKTLDELLEEVKNNSTVDDSLIALAKSWKAQLDEVLSGVVIPPAVQTKIDAIFDISKADSEKVAAAVLEGTPQNV